MVTNAENFGWEDLLPMAERGEKLPDYCHGYDRLAWCCLKMIFFCHQRGDFKDTGKQKLVDGVHSAWNNAAAELAEAAPITFEIVKED